MIATDGHQTHYSGLCKVFLPFLPLYSVTSVRRMKNERTRPSLSKRSAYASKRNSLNKSNNIAYKNTKHGTEAKYLFKILTLE